MWGVRVCPPLATSSWQAAECAGYATRLSGPPQTMPVPRSLAQRLLLPMSLGAFVGAVLFWVSPIAVFLTAGFALLASPVTLLVLGLFAFVIARAAATHRGRLLWLVLGSIPFVAFTSLLVFGDQAWHLLYRIVGDPRLESSNLGRPGALGVCLAPGALYMALISGVLAVQVGSPSSRSANSPANGSAGAQ